MSAGAKSKPRVIAGNALLTHESSGTTAVRSPTTHTCAADRFIPRGWRDRGGKTSVSLVMAARGHFVPRVSRPSTSSFRLRQDVDARHKAGHDGGENYARANAGR